jgi:hypothetical protein
MQPGEESCGCQVKHLQTFNSIVTMACYRIITARSDGVADAIQAQAPGVRRKLKNRRFFAKNTLGMTSFDCFF